MRFSQCLTARENSTECSFAEGYRILRLAAIPAVVSDFEEKERMTSLIGTMPKRSSVPCDCVDDRKITHSFHSQ